MRLLYAGLVLVTALTANGGGCGGPLNDTATETATEKGIAEVRINDGSGNVTVTAADVREARITRTFHFNGDRPTTKHEVNGNVLVLTLRCGNQCRVDYKVEVPAATRVTGKSSSGDVTVDGVSTVDVGAKSGKVTVRNIPGAVTVSTKSGDISLASVGGSVTATASSGGVTAKDLRGATVVHGSSGGIDIQLTKSANADIDANSGDVTLTVPGGTYRVQTSSKSGSVQVGVSNDANAALHLKVTTRSGNIAVRSAAA